MPSENVCAARLAGKTRTRGLVIVSEFHDSGMQAVLDDEKRVQAATSVPKTVRKIGLQGNHDWSRMSSWG